MTWDCILEVGSAGQVPEINDVKTGAKGLPYLEGTPYF
jgi:hypothetical protein